MLVSGFSLTQGALKDSCAGLLSQLGILLAALVGDLPASSSVYAVARRPTVKVGHGWVDRRAEDGPRVLHRCWVTEGWFLGHLLLDTLRST